MSRKPAMPEKHMNSWQKGAAVVVAVVLIVTFGFLLRDSINRIEHVPSTYSTEDLQELTHVEGLEVDELSQQASEDIETHLSLSDLQTFASNIQSGGPPPDGIPPVDEPQYVSVSDSDGFLVDDDWVFVTRFDDGVKVYPQKILVWHEVVNDTYNGKTGSVTYCPLTGTVIGFWGDVDGATTTFGTSGRLLNSNLVMYDRDSNSYWPQILRTAVSGSRTGEVLDSFPVSWSRWSTVKASYPDAQVLSRTTGFIRAYGNDPYGEYSDDGSYYNSGGAFFKLTNTDDRLEDKEVVIGVYGQEGSQFAILKSKVQEQQQIEFTIDGQDAVAVWDEELQAVFVYEDSETQQWIPSMDAMWFAWVADFPDTALIQ